MLPPFQLWHISGLLTICHTWWWPDSSIAGIASPSVHHRTSTAPAHVAPTESFLRLAGQGLGQGLGLGWVEGKVRHATQKSQICSNVNCRLAGRLSTIAQDGERRTKEAPSPRKLRKGRKGIVLSCLTASLHVPAKVFGRWQLDLVLSDLSLNINSRVQPLLFSTRGWGRTKVFHWQVKT